MTSGNIPTHPMSCVSALKHFFGDHPTNSTHTFVQEYKALTEDDVSELHELLAEVGYNLN